jgi:hypothetical protein
MSCIEHFLSSSISLRNKEVLIFHGGKKFEGSGLVFWKTLWQLFVITLEHGTCLCLVLQLGNFIFS